MRGREETIDRRASLLKNNKPPSHPDLHSCQNDPLADFDGVWIISSGVNSANHRSAAPSGAFYFETVEGQCLVFLSFCFLNQTLFSLFHHETYYCHHPDLSSICCFGLWKHCTMHHVVLKRQVKKLDEKTWTTNKRCNVFVTSSNQPLTLFLCSYLTSSSNDQLILKNVDASNAIMNSLSSDICKSQTIAIVNQLGVSSGPTYLTLSPYQFDMVSYNEWYTYLFLIW